MRPYQRSTGGFHDEFHHHQASRGADARVEILFAGARCVEVLTSHCTSSFEAMPNLLVRPPLAWPFLAMSRITIESAARIVHLLDPSIDADQRLMRFCALIAWSEREEAKALDATSRLTNEVMTEMRESLQRRITALDRYVTEAGFALDRSPRNPVVRDPSGGRTPESSDLAFVDLLEAEFPGSGNEFYRHMSGFVHGAPWALNANLSVVPSAIGAPSLARVPDVSRSQIVYSFLLTTDAVTHAMYLSAVFSGISFGLVERRARRLRGLSEAEARRLNKPKRRIILSLSRRGTEDAT